MIALTCALFAFVLLALFAMFLNSLRKRVGALPSWRILAHGIKCQDCGHVAQEGRWPYARWVCPLCKTDSYYL